MTNEANKTNETNATVEEKLQPANDKKNEKEQSVLGSLLKDYTDRVNTSGELLRNKFLDLLVNRELDERVALLDNALKKRVDLERDVKKASKPDARVRNASGEIVSEGFSEAEYKKLEEARAKLKKLDDAIDLALSENNYTKLKESKDK